MVSTSSSEGILYFDVFHLKTVLRTKSKHVKILVSGFYALFLLFKIIYEFINVFKVFSRYFRQKYIENEFLVQKKLCISIFLASRCPKFREK
jgi:hypothetical protein